MNHRVAITGLGLVCSQGQDPQAVFEQWCAGQSGIDAHTLGSDAHQLTAAYSLCSDFDAAATLGKTALTTLDRTSQLSVCAAADAWSAAGLAQHCPYDKDEAAVLWGTGAAGGATLDKGYRELFLKNRARISPLSVVLGMHNAAAAQIAMRLGLGGACLTYSVACASSAVAIGEAFWRVRSGQTPVAIAGGGEGQLPYGLLKAWESMHIMAPAALGAQACQPFAAERKGLVLGEGAAALVLEDWESARARGATIHAELIGYASTCDHHHLTQPQAQGQIRALHQVLRQAQLQPQDIDYINAHGTATPEGDPTEIASLRAVLGEHAPRTLISSTKSMHGHLLGAAGALEVLVCALALQNQCAPPTAHLGTIAPDCEGLDHVRGQARQQAMEVALCNSFAFGGSNAVLALRRAA